MTFAHAVAGLHRLPGGVVREQREVARGVSVGVLDDVVSAAVLGGRPRRWTSRIALRAPGSGGISIRSSNRLDRTTVVRSACK
ncbi:hypothetical protein EA473_05980 [Natrarchaeobius chitinivorans]|uniref:Uncharacterized protein n=1 Tax=Natrarchaeobius chitinivorans TaxID=1679083 RepID=A0A3N6M0A5_NATCH|nr:hypothetical protein EA473_05980 [Natrarchaeobius chitinivorans]